MFSICLSLENFSFSIPRPLKIGWTTAPQSRTAPTAQEQLARVPLHGLACRLARHTTQILAQQRRTTYMGFMFLVKSWALEVSMPYMAACCCKNVGWPTTVHSRASSYGAFTTCKYLRTLDTNA